MKEEKSIKGYIRNSKAWYKDAFKGENISLTIGDYYDDGSTTGEFQIEWIPLSDFVAPKLKMFDDSWHLLNKYTDFFKCLSKLDSKEITENDLCKELDKLGFKDLTEYEK